MLAVLSDVHANLEALLAVLADVQAQGAEASAFALLGDVIGFHADPAACVELLRGLPLRAAVRGNHEEALRHRGYFGSMPLIDRMVERTRAMLPADALAWLTSLPVTAEAEAEAEKVFFVHSSPHEPEKWGRIRQVDEANAVENLAVLRQRFPRIEIIPISAAMGDGIPAFKERLQQLLAEGEQA